MLPSQRVRRTERSSEGVFVSFADLFMCLLVVMLFQLNPPAPNIESLSDTSQEAPADQVALYVRLHGSARLSQWDAPEVELQSTQIAQQMKEKEANALVLIGDDNTTIKAYFTAVDQLSALQVPISYGREKQ